MPSNKTDLKQPNQLPFLATQYLNIMSILSNIPSSSYLLKSNITSYYYLPTSFSISFFKRGFPL